MISSRRTPLHASSALALSGLWPGGDAAAQNRGSLKGQTMGFVAPYRAAIADFVLLGQIAETRGRARG